MRRHSNGWLRVRDAYVPGTEVLPPGSMPANQGAVVGLRFNTVAHKVQTFAEMHWWAGWEKDKLSRNLMTFAPQAHPDARRHPLFMRGQTLQKFWTSYCKPIAIAADGSVHITAGTVPLTRLWTSADAGHIHALSGAVYMLMGLAYMCDLVASDLAVLRGAVGVHSLPVEWAFLSLACGAVNALSGMQPALLSRSLGDFLQAMGFGQHGSLKSGGFVNGCLFWILLAYQSLRPLPCFPAGFQLLDPVVAVMTILTTLHSKFILDGFVDANKLHSTDVSKLFVPGILNWPVSLHLFFEGQKWVDLLSQHCASWPEVFFTSNYALAWASSAVMFSLSLFERGVITKQMQLSLIVCIPLAAVVVILLQVAVLAPEDGWTMLTGFV